MGGGKREGCYPHQQPHHQHHRQPEHGHGGGGRDGDRHRHRDRGGRGDADRDGDLQPLQQQQLHRAGDAGTLVTSDAGGGHGASSLGHLLHVPDAGGGGGLLLV